MTFKTIHTTYGLLAVLVAAVGKEVWDAKGHGKPDVCDAPAIATIT